MVRSNEANLANSDDVSILLSIFNKMRLTSVHFSIQSGNQPLQRNNKVKRQDAQFFFSCKGNTAKTPSLYTNSTKSTNRDRH